MRGEGKDAAPEMDKAPETPPHAWGRHLDIVEFFG
jgi:hypothetical protein